MLPEAEAFTFLWPGLSLKLHYFIIVIRLRPGQCSVFTSQACHPLLCRLQVTKHHGALESLESLDLVVRTSLMCPF